MPKYTFFVDIWLLRLGCNFIFEYLLLWATATITRSSTRPGRLALASAAGTFHYLLYLLAGLGLIPFYGLLGFLPVIILVSAAMILIAFHPLPRARLLSTAGYFYGIGFAAAGAGMAGAYLFGGAGKPLFPVGTLISIAAILIIAELGWGAVHRRMLNQVYRLPMEISCNNSKIKLKALIDTGNNLRDPLNKQPVIVVEQSALRQMLPPELISVIQEVGQGKLSALNRLAALETWHTRIRLIPFNSIGKKNGLLVGFRPDEVRVGQNPMNSNLHPTIAIHPYPLDPNGEYKALVPPAVVESTLQGPGQSTDEGGESHANAAPSDF